MIKYTFNTKTNTEKKDTLYDFDIECGVGKVELYIN